MGLSIEELRTLAGKSDEELEAIVQEQAAFEAEMNARAEEREKRPLDIQDEARSVEWRIKRYIDKGADMKTVLSILSAALGLSFADKGYVFKIKAERLY